MNLSDPVELLDLDGLLPPDGESGYEISMTGNTLDVTVIFDSEGGGTGKICLRFFKAAYFYLSPFYGHSVFHIQGGEKSNFLGALVEYKNSDLLDADRALSGDFGRRHFRVFLHSVGVSIHVVACSFEALK
ncbi:MAG: hypothetical protein ACOY3X_05330 [Pseudomonadota bacterium]